MEHTQKPSILTCQIIVGALMAGVLAFAVVAVSAGLAPDAGDEDARLPIVSLVMATFAVVAVLARFVVPPILVATQRRRAISEDSEEERTNFLTVFTTKTIVENALPEGACFAALVGYVVEGQWWLLAVVAALLALMALGFPTESKFENWYRSQRELAELDR